MYSNSGFQEQKSAKVDLNAYKLMVKENLSTLLFKTFAKNKE